MSQSYEDISAAIILYLNYGKAPSPQRNKAVVFEHFSPERAEHIFTAAEKIVLEASQFPIDWKQNNLVSAGKAVRAEIRVSF